MALIPPQAREFPLSEIGLSTRVHGHLERAGLETVWDVMERLAGGDEGLLMLEGIGPKSLTELKGCIDALALPEVAEEEAPTEEEIAVEAVKEAVEAPEVEAVIEEPVEAVEEVVEEEVLEPASVQEIVEEEQAEIEPMPVVAEAPQVFYEEEEDLDELVGKGQRKERKRHRALVYDEDLGEVVAVHRRKREGDGDDTEDWEQYL